MSEYFKRLGIDIIGELAFGFSFNTQVHDKYRHVYELNETLAWRLNTYMQFPAIRPIELFLLLVGAKQATKFIDTIKYVLTNRISKKKDAYHDLYSMIIDNLVQEEGRDVVTTELMTEAVAFLTAGGLSIATALSAVFFYLSRCPKSYDKLAVEIRSSFSSAEEIHGGPKLASCRYLRACIDESLRMSSPAQSHSWREFDDKESGPFIVDGHVIPPGVQVAINPYAMLHNDEYFTDPFVFHPERWLDSNAGSDSEETDAKSIEEARVAMRQAFNPFSLGDRSCVGKSMAYLEISLVLAQTLWLFDFETAQGREGDLGGGTTGRKDRNRHDEFQLGDILVTRHQGPNLIFKKRGDHWKDIRPGE
ncbi:hypothetical protein QQS21_004203 [Conoideocrella luteorostrata]|uniref:Cytochrome P450 n=1 Tax=Conoideocrella luteorostrata TaxID=1105319 RepID=A0AAJ0CRY9_9HYPO|nr:hypothetical protein QQS21_004203 [Conoideocrella luteorostrata]